MFRSMVLQMDREKTRETEGELTSSVTYASRNHTNGINRKRRTVVEGIKGIDSRIKDRQECRAASIKSIKMG